MRVLVVGPGGSGVSALSTQIAERLDLPMHKLDVIMANRRWSRQATLQELREQRAIASGERWVIAGTHLPTLAVRLARADTVIFLDLPPAQCLWALARGFAPSSPQPAPRLRYLLYVARYRSTARPQILQAVAEHAPRAQFLHVTSRRQAGRLLDLLVEQGGAGDGPSPTTAAGRARAAHSWGQQHDSEGDAGLAAGGDRAS